MTVANIEDALQKTPFAPFEVHFDNGKSVRVVHPDCVWFTPAKKTAVIAEGERLHIVDVDHITSLTLAVH